MVDMQPYFALEKDIIPQCKREIKKAIAGKEYIIFLEFNNCGVTDDALIKMIIGYSNCSIISKCDNDGSFAIIKEMKEENLKYTHFKVCGVYTDQCVLSTVRGLNGKLKQCTIEIIQDAVKTIPLDTHMRALENMKQMPRVWLS
jgi:nicotinamidase-related amidase